MGLRFRRIPLSRQGSIQQLHFSSSSYSGWWYTPSQLQGGTLMSSKTSIYEAIGGADAVSLAVDAFYDRVLADPLLLPLFTNTAIPRLKSHQKAFFTWVLGGPNAYQ